MPEFTYKTAQKMKLEKQQHEISQSLERHAKLTADVKPFNAASYVRKEI